MAEAHAPGDSRSAVVLLGTTEAGKEIKLVRQPECSVRLIDYQDCKKLPEQLQGGFSSVAAATRTVESYLAKVAAKEIKLDGTKYPSKVK